MQENKIQSQCFQWYWNNYCLKTSNPRCIMFSVPNDIAGTNKISMMQAKAMGLVAGVSDTIILHKNKEVLFCEFKNEIGRQSDAQKFFEKTVSNLGFEYKLIRSFNEFKEWIEKKS